MGEKPKQLEDRLENIVDGRDLQFAASRINLDTLTDKDGEAVVGLILAARETGELIAVEQDGDLAGIIIPVTEGGLTSEVATSYQRLSSRPFGKSDTNLL